jgi:hypothetical protein
MSWYDYYEKEPNYATLRDGLADESADIVKKLYAKLKLLEKLRRKDEIAARIAQHLANPAHVKALYNQLDDLQQKAVAEAIYDPKGRFDEDKFAAKYGRKPSWKKDGEKKIGAMGFSYGSAPADWSLLNLVIIRRRIVPGDLRERLLAFVPAPDKARLTTHTEDPPAQFAVRWRERDWRTNRIEERAEQVDVTVRETERAALQNLAAVLRLVDAGQIAVSEKTLQPSAAAQQTIAEALRDGDFYDATAPAGKGRPRADAEQPGAIQAFAWPMLLQAAKLAEISHKKLAFTAAGRKTLAKPAETLRLLWQNWRKTRFFDELRRIENIKGQTGKGQKGLTGVANRRASIAQALEQCPVGAWVKIDDFLRFIKAAGHDFKVSREPWELYIESAYYGNLHENGNWLMMEGRFALCFLFEYAATLGLLDVAYAPPQGVRKDYQNAWGADGYEFFSRYDGLLFFRLTPLGAYCLGLTKDYAPPVVSVKGRLTILPSLKITAQNALSPDETLLLELYADRLSDKSWHLSAPKTASALAQGSDAGELRAFLAAREEQELPDTVERFIRDAQSRARALKDRGQARLIECADAATAQLIATNANLKKYCYRAGDKALVVPEDTEKQFRQALLALGYCLP